MKINKKIVLSIMVALILVLVPTISAEQIILEDADGFETKVEAPVETIVCLSTSANQIIKALNSFDKVIAWDENSQEDMFPRPDKKLKVVAGNSHSPQIEAIAELDPDIVIADTMLQKDHREKIKSFGIPIIAERTSDPERILTTISNIGKIVGKRERAEDLISFITNYRDLIEKRVATLEESEKKKVYWEWYEPFKTGAKGSMVNPKIVQAGGKNIAVDAKGRYPTVSSEYVWESNPEVIVKQASRRATQSEMKKAYNKIINRESLESSSAVKNKNVHVITWDVFSGLPSVVGDLYFAKWIQPELFEDIDPENVYSELLSKFFGVEEFTSRVYSEK